MSDKTKHKVAVYGTLKKGYGLHPNLQSLGAEYVGDATVKGTFLHLGAYPAIVQGMPEFERDIPCEIYEVDDRCLARLDMVEGVPSLYQRVEVDTVHGKAFVYVQDVSRHRYQTRKLILEGGWEGANTPTTSVDFWLSKTDTPAVKEPPNEPEHTGIFPKVVNV